MNLNQLRYAQAVAQTGSFTQAAEQCYVTQPTLSNGIAQLEKEFEERLFARTTRKVVLTPFGEHILPFIEKVLNAETELLHEARSFVHPSKAIVRIGTSPLLGSNWLMPMLEKFRRILPDIEIILHEQNISELYRMLDESLIDFVFGVGDVPKQSWNRTVLYKEPLYFIPCGEGFSGDGETITFDDIAKETFVMVPNACGLAGTTRALFRSHRRNLNEYAGVALSYQVLEEWAALGLGAAILPKSKLRSSENKAYVLTDKQGNDISVEFEAVWLNTPQLASHLKKLIEFLNDYQETNG